MVAIFSGSGEGLIRSSANILGAAGQIGGASLGRGGENVSVNAATGNLVIARRDEFLAGRGPDATVERTYNSLTLATDGDNGDQWHQSTVRRLFGLTGTLNTAGSTIKRQAGDGSIIVHTWNAAQAAYVATDGDGAHDTIVKSGSTWIWTDGSSRVTETYEAYVADPSVFRIKEQKDSDGYRVSFAYVSGTNKLDRITTHNHGYANADTGIAEQSYIQYVWSGNNIARIVTGYTDYGDSSTAADNVNRTLTRTRYAYDAQNRLIEVTVDLSPEDNSVSDGRIYVTSYTYDGNSNRVASITQTDGSSLAIAYDEAGRVATLTQHVAMGDVRVTRIGYGVNVTSITGPDGGVTRLWYDNKQQLVQVMGPPATQGGISQVVQYEYDAAGNLIRTIETDSANASIPNNLVDASAWADGEAAGRGENLVDDGGWPQDVDGALPANGTVGQGWTGSYLSETEWTVTTGPYGKQVVSLHTGQDDADDPGGGAYSESFPINKSKAYEFTLYFKVDALDKHRVYFGLGSGTVKDGASGAYNGNPYFTWDHPSSATGEEAGKWYKIVGYVLPESTPLEADGSYGGIYDLETGERIKTVKHFIWDDTQTHGSTLARFFNYYNQDRQGKFTHFFKPEVREVSDTAILRSGDALDTDRDRNLLEVPYPSGWSNVQTIAGDNEARWGEVVGPDGAWQIGLETGQFDSVANGGGGFTNRFTVDPSKTYRFTQYVRKSDLAKHNIYFGLSTSSTPYVRSATNGADNSNPYFLSWAPSTQQAYMEEDGWYKIIGYVLPKGSANVAVGSLGGVYDAATGERVASVGTFRWHESMPNDQVYARFFTYYDETQHGWSTDWLAPEVVAIEAGDLATDNADPFGIVYDEGGRTTRYTYDANGNVLTRTDANGNVVTRTYGSKSELLTETRAGSDAAGANVSHTTRYVYDSENHLRYVVSAEGRVTEYSYTYWGAPYYTIEYPEHSYAIGSGALTEATMNAWRDGLVDRSSVKLRRYVYDARDNLTSTLEYGTATAAGAATTAEGYSRTYYNYDQAGQLLSRYVPGQNTESFIYDGLGRHTASTDLAGGTTRIIYDDAASTTIVALGTGKVTTSVFNRAGDLISEIETENFNDTATSNLIAAQDLDNWSLGRNTASSAGTINGEPAVRYTVAGSQSGQSQHITAPSAGAVGANDVITATIALQATTSSNSAAFGVHGSATGWGYGDPTLGVARIVSGPGTVAKAWSSEGFFYVTGLSTTEPTVIEIQRRFDREQTASVMLYPDFPGGSVLGNAIIASAPSMSKSHVSESSNLYDRNGRLRVATDATGRKSYYLYDKAGRKIADINHYGHVAEYRHDSAGRVIATANYTYALTAAQIAALGDPDNTLEMADIRPSAHSYDIWTWSIYDDAGRLIESIDGKGGVAAFSYDASDRLIKTVSYAGKLSTAQLAAFKAEPPTALVLPAANTAKDAVSRSFYDREGQLIGKLDGEGYLTEIVYDEAGQKVEEVAYAKKISSSYWASGSFNQLRANAAPTASANRRTHYVYDGQGLLRHTIDNGGYVTSHAYNYARKLTTTIVHAAPISTGDFTYDNVKALVNAIASEADDRESYNVYNGEGQVAFTIGAGNVVNGFSYDLAGNVTEAVRYAALRNTPSLPSLVTMNNWAAAQAGNGGNRTTRSWYTAGGELRFTVDAEGYVKRFDYDAEGRLTREVSWANAVAATQTTTIAQIDALTGSAGSWAELTYTYDAAGRRNSVNDGEGNRTLYGWRANGTRASVYRAYGTADQSVTVFVNDGAGRIIREYRAYGEAERANVAYTYDGLGNRTSMTDANGKVTHYTYDERGQLLTTTDAEGGVTHYEYNAFGEVVKTIDPGGGVTYHYYDTFGQEVRTRDAENYVTVTSYTVFGEVESVRRYYNKTASTPSTTTLPLVAAHAKDAITRFEYDKRGLVSKTTDAESFSESYIYDAFGNRTSMTNKLGGVTTYVYDKRGLLVRETLPITSYNTDGTAQATSVANSYSYDARGNRTQMIEAVGLAEARTTSYVYDKADRLVETRGEARAVLSQADHKTIIANFVPRETRSYDGRGNVTSVTDAAGNRTVYYYDDLDRKVVEIDPAGTYTAYGYDKNGNVTATRVYETLVAVPIDGGSQGEAPTAPSGSSRATSFTYDNLGRLLTSSVAGVETGHWNGSGWVAATGTITTSYQYDALGNVVRVTDPNGHATYTYYDNLGRKTASVDAEGYKTIWTYDGEGNVLTERRYANRYTGTPSLAAPPSVSTNGADRVTTFTYDRTGNRLSEARSGVIVHNGSGGTSTVTATVSWLYNGLGQVTRKTEATGDQINYIHDEGGRLLQERRAAFTSHQGGSVTPTLHYRYNGLGDLVRTVAAGAGDAVSRGTAYSYGAGGLLASMTDAEGVTHSYAYDKRGILIRDQYYRAGSAGGTGTLNAVLTKVDELGRMIERTVAVWNGSAWTPGEVVTTDYNAFGEVSRSGINGGAIAEGSRLWQTQNKYDAAGRLWATNAGDGVWKYFGYDKSGNQTVAITSAGTNLAGKTFDQARALVSGSGVNATYTVYDKRGLAKSVVEEGRQLSNSTTATLTMGRTYNGFGEVVSETDAGGAVTSYIYNTAGRMIRSEGPTVWMTNEDGRVQWIKPSQDYYYDASGRLVAMRDANGDYPIGSMGNPDPAFYDQKEANTGNLTRLTLLAGTGYGGSEALVTAETHADGGIKRTAYDVHGDARKITDEIGRVITQRFDKVGRVTQVNSAGGLIDYYAYDSLGQQVSRWNNVYGAADRETTDYDVQGRVVSKRAYGGDEVHTTYAWQAGSATNAIGNFGGWVKTVSTDADRASSSDNIKASVTKADVFGRTVSRTDASGEEYAYTYDIAGRLTHERTVVASNGLILNKEYDYYNSGLVRSVLSGESEVANTNWKNKIATYGYDKLGRLTFERLESAQGTFIPGHMEYIPPENGEPGFPGGDTPIIIPDDPEQGEWVWVPESYTVNRTVLQDGTAQYDALGRMTRYLDRDANGSTLVDKSWAFDANSNVRSITTTYRPMNLNKTLGSAVTTSYHYRYDALDRVVVSKGIRSGSTIVAGGSGVALTYDAAGRRTTSKTGYAAQEIYGYDANDRITSVRVGSVTRMSASYDALGRLTGHIERNASGSLVYERHSFVYNSRDQVLSEKGRRKLDNGDWNYTHTANYYSDTGAGSNPGVIRYSSDTGSSSGELLYRSETKNWLNGPYPPHYNVNPNGTTSPGTPDANWADEYSTYTYDWRAASGGGGARQATHKLINRDGTTQTTNVYGADGAIERASSSTLSGSAPVQTHYYRTDIDGRILARDLYRSGTTYDPSARYYTFGGRAMGEIGTDGSDNVDFATAIARRDDTGNGSFRGGATSGQLHADFDLNHRTLAATSQINGSGYVARGGESLQQVAAAVWGDASLWYKLAEANSLGAGAILGAGQSLRIPAGVQVNTHNADTVRPYDPSAALGDISPATPQPKKQKGDDCGVLGAMLLTVVAVAVTTIATAGAAAAISGKAFGTVLGAMTGGATASGVGAGAWMAGGAIGGAAGSIASQGVGVATGLQDRFNWKGVGLAALSGGIGGGLGPNFGAGWQGAAVRGAVGNALTQGVGVATGLQSKFDFAGVAAAGVGAATGRAIAGRVGTGFGASLATHTAGGIADAATRSALNGESFGRNLTTAIP
ncbi:RHS repeat protein, partial [Pelagerythrobacter marensis]|uniref:RHS repeat protein n=1 Tax=Pelagerythrobacter marensis TaxID=543877 RepID=UPI000A44ED38